MCFSEFMVLDKLHAAVFTLIRRESSQRSPTGYNKNKEVNVLTDDIFHFITYHVYQAATRRSTIC